MRKRAVVSVALELQLNVSLTRTITQQRESKERMKWRGQRSKRAPAFGVLAPRPPYFTGPRRRRPASLKYGPRRRDRAASPGAPLSLPAGRGWKRHSTGTNSTAAAAWYDEPRRHPFRQYSSSLKRTRTWQCRRPGRPGY